MKTYARIQDGRVAELFATDDDITKMFHRDITWVNVSMVQDVAVGWGYDGQRFALPPTPVPAPPSISLLDLQAQIAELSAKIEALAEPT